MEKILISPSLYKSLIWRQLSHVFVMVVFVCFHLSEVSASCSSNFFFHSVFPDLWFSHHPSVLLWTLVDWCPVWVAVLKIECTSELSNHLTRLIPDRHSSDSKNFYFSWSYILSLVSICMFMHDYIFFFLFTWHLNLQFVFLSRLKCCGCWLQPILSGIAICILTRHWKLWAWQIR